MPVMHPPPVVRNPNSKAPWIVAGVAIVVGLLMMVFACGLCFIAAAAFRFKPYGGKAVALIEVQGVLTSNSSSIVQSGTTSQSIVDQLQQALNDDRVKSVLIRVDSPGGTPAAAQEIYREIARVRAEGKPVVISVGDLCASAAYYFSAAANTIVALPDSDVGSIGVIVQVPNIQGLETKIGISFTTITEGQFKDIGSPLRPVTPEEQAIIQGQAQVAYDNFIAAVAKGRKLTEKRVRELAVGLTWPASQAKTFGLVDRMGNYQDAVNVAGRMGGLSGDIHIIRMGEVGGFSLLRALLDGVNKLSDKLDVNNVTNQQPIKR
jgi:protease IV